MAAPKDGSFTQLGVVSLDGTSLGPNFPASLAAGEGRPIMVDNLGRVAARLADSMGWVDGAFAGIVQVNTGLLLVSWAVLHVGPCKLLQFSAARETGTGDRFVMFFDLAAGPPPGGVRPLVSIGWRGPDSFPVPSAPEGWTFANGLLVAISQGTATSWSTPGADQWTFNARLGV